MADLSLAAFLDFFVLGLPSDRASRLALDFSLAGGFLLMLTSSWVRQFTPLAVHFFFGGGLLATDKEWFAVD
jgi:hypothetical protein